MSPLKEIVDGIHSQVAKIEDDLKVRVSEYNNIRSQLNAINRKQTGSLAVRDLSNLVKPEDIVPRSSKKLYEDNEYALYTVTLFSRVADNFRTSAREKGFQIRDFEYSPETHENRKQELDKLVQDQERLRASLLQWCYTSYGEVFSSWMHFCAVRLFAESILRYGLPPSFLACVLAPSVKSEKKVRSILEGLTDSTNRQGRSDSCEKVNLIAYWKTEDEVGAGMAGLAGDADAHPYVSFTINVA
ncbi:V-type proton ATPase subunit C [Glycine soja]|nr:V-type proton ATPase subunit C [Glycine max]